MALESSSRDHDKDQRHNNDDYGIDIREREKCLAAIYAVFVYSKIVTELHIQDTDCDSDQHTEAESHIILMASFFLHIQECDDIPPENVGQHRRRAVIDRIDPYIHLPEVCPSIDEPGDHISVQAEHIDHDQQEEITEVRAAPLLVHDAADIKNITEEHRTEFKCDIDDTDRFLVLDMQADHGADRQHYPRNKQKRTA